MLLEPGFEAWKSLQEPYILYLFWPPIFTTKENVEKERVTKTANQKAYLNRHVRLDQYFRTLHFLAPAQHLFGYGPAWERVAFYLQVRDCCSQCRGDGSVCWYRDVQCVALKALVGRDEGAPSGSYDPGRMRNTLRNTAYLKHTENFRVRRRPVSVLTRQGRRRGDIKWRVHRNHSEVTIALETDVLSNAEWIVCGVRCCEIGVVWDTGEWASDLRTDNCLRWPGRVGVAGLSGVVCREIEARYARVDCAIRVRSACQSHISITHVRWRGAGDAGTLHQQLCPVVGAIALLPARDPGVFHWDIQKTRGQEALEIYWVMLRKG